VRTNPDIRYRLACLCDLRDEAGRMLLLHRAKPPNQGLWSPVGGKLDTATGESPAGCARREIQEETGLDVPLERLHLLGLISEEAGDPEGSGTGGDHWLLFYFRVRGAVDVGSVRIGTMPEGELAWVDPGVLEGLAIAETDRRVIWPLVARTTAADGRAPGFFSVHLRHDPGLVWEVHQVIPPGTASG
jgi:8-oxo-dGTP diphosphatase